MIIIWAFLAAGWFVYFIIRRLEQALKQTLAQAEAFSATSESSILSVKTRTEGQLIKVPAINGLQPHKGVKTQIVDTLSGKITVLPTRQLVDHKPSDVRLN
jgi:hypothetical protein